MVLVKGGSGHGQVGHCDQPDGGPAPATVTHAQYATGSKAFTETLRERNRRTWRIVQFTYFNSYMNARSRHCRRPDLRRGAPDSDSTATTDSRRSRIGSNKLQVDELLDVSRVSVFFIDDDQVVRPGEIGSVDLIKERAKRQADGT